MLDAPAISRVDRTATKVLMLLMVGTYVVVGLTLGLLIGQPPVLVVLAMAATGWFPLASLVVNRRRSARRELNKVTAMQEEDRHVEHPCRSGRCP
jgi:hypothetical protein